MADDGLDKPPDGPDPLIAKALPFFLNEFFPAFLFVTSDVSAEPAENLLDRVLPVPNRRLEVANPLLRDVLDHHFVQRDLVFAQGTVERHEIVLRCTLSECIDDLVPVVTEVPELLPHKTGIEPLAPRAVVLQDALVHYVLGEGLGREVVDRLVVEAEKLPPQRIFSLRVRAELEKPPVLQLWPEPVHLLLPVIVVTKEVEKDAFQR